MAISCANCGRGDLMQPDLANYQCLACGSLTNMATGQLVRGDLPNIIATSPSGHPIIELSTGDAIPHPLDFAQEVSVSDTSTGFARSDASAEQWRAEQVPEPAPAPVEPETPVDPAPAPVETPEPTPAPVEPEPVPEPPAPIPEPVVEPSVPEPTPEPVAEPVPAPVVEAPPAAV